MPTYNPTVVYGTPYVTPGYSTAAVVTTAVLAFGVGIAIGAAMSNSWGYSYWNCNWHGGTVVYRSTGYYGNSAWHGGYYGSTASAYGPYGSAHASAGYNPSTGTYARGASASNAYGSQAVGQAYNPNTGAYAATHQASNAYGSYGSSVVLQERQHRVHAAADHGEWDGCSAQTSAGGSAVAASGKYGNSGGVAQTANGNKYAACKRKRLQEHRKRLEPDPGDAETTSSYSGANSAAAHGYGGQEKSTWVIGLVAEAVAVAGNPGRRALEARQAAAAVAAGAVAGRRDGIASEVSFSERYWQRVLRSKFLEDVMSLKHRRIAFTIRLLLLALVHSACRLQKSRQTCNQRVCFS